MVAVKQDNIVGQSLLQINNLLEVLLQLNERNPSIRVKIVTDEDVDAVFVNQFLPIGSAVDVAYDVVCGHNTYITLI